MEIQLTPELDGFIQYAIAKGHYRSQQEAVHSALAMWEEHERARLELMDELEAADHSIDAGQGVEVDSEEEMSAFFDDIKRRGRERIAKAQIGPS